MTVEFRDTVTIAAPVGVVADIMKAVERWPGWTASVSTVDRKAIGPLSVGEVVVMKQPKLPASTWTVTRADATGFEWTAASPGIRNVAGHWATDNGDGTCTVELSLSFAGPLARITTLFYAGLIRRYVATEAAGLRKEAEGQDVE